MFHRLFGLLLIFMAAICLLLVFHFPGRDSNTGMADSGCFGFVASGFLIFGFALLIQGRSFRL